MRRSPWGVPLFASALRPQGQRWRPWPRPRRSQMVAARVQDDAWLRTLRVAERRLSAAVRGARLRATTGSGWGENAAHGSPGALS